MFSNIKHFIFTNLFSFFFFFVFSFFLLLSIFLFLTVFILLVERLLILVHGGHLVAVLLLELLVILLLLDALDLALPELLHGLVLAAASLVDADGGLLRVLVLQQAQQVAQVEGAQALRLR